MKPQEFLDKKQAAKSWWNTLTHLQKASMLIELRGEKMHNLMCSILGNGKKAKPNEIYRLYEQYGTNNTQSV